MLRVPLHVLDTELGAPAYARPGDAGADLVARHDVVLPGSGKEAIPFLMYPNGETAEGRLDSLSPSTFRYEIRVREVTS